MSVLQNRDEELLQNYKPLGGSRTVQGLLIPSLDTRSELRSKTCWRRPEIGFVEHAIVSAVVTWTYNAVIVQVEIGPILIVR